MESDNIPDSDIATGVGPHSSKTQYPSSSEVAKSATAGKRKTKKEGVITKEDYEETSSRSSSSCCNISDSEIPTLEEVEVNMEQFRDRVSGATESKTFSVPRNITSKSRTRWTAAALGQILSLILCVSAVTSVYLTDVYNLHISNAQNFVFYSLLSAIFTSALACRSGSANLFSVMKTRDIQEGIPIGQGSVRLLGDLLCLSGAFLYGVSNVAQEFLVKTFDIVEFLGMIGLFGSVVTGIQTAVLEYDQITSAVVNGSPIPLALLGGYALAQLSFYVLAAIMMKLSGATPYNLSILTADFYSLLVGIFLFQYQFHALYFISFLFVILGVVIFSLKPTLHVLLQNETDRGEREPLIASASNRRDDNDAENGAPYSSTCYQNLKN
ncbi:Solute carrier family 35 member F2 [Orchesella cincta]|uniref:Solute carrier family 35 member F2 n=1 Tax=Orchesella cincta TaxID=48709 RepID=A0A1D2MJC2_ORCCI|nr:Solute carrier family 35 member F2 [Orchesella cincta]